MNKVLVIPWGNPFEWRNVTYVYDESGKEVVMENIPCTLPILKEAIKPDKIIIIVLDTLANVVKNGKPYPKRDFSSYEEVKDDVKKRIKYFIEEKINCDFSEMELLIAPGVGVFENIRVEGEILDYYHYIIWELARKFPTEDMTVYLDLTHGINFMPALTYRALVNLLGLASYLKDVWFKVLNSEPYPRGIPQDEIQKLRLRIRIVEDREIKPKPILSLLEDERFNRWNAFISSVANGFPLVFTTFYPEIGEVKEEIDKKLKVFFNGITVEGIYIRRETNLNSDFKTLSKLYYFLKVLSTNKRLKRKTEIILDELRMISETLFNKLPRIGIIVENQIKDLENYIPKIQKKLTSSKKKCDVLENLIKDKKDNIDNISKDEKDLIKVVRNFIAHSGFEYSIVNVCKRYDGLKFAYKSKESVIQYSIKSLQFRLKGSDQ